ncbi:MAG TPA: type I DNA topoisomerase [candidate division Zixibacteria bacterium]|nr:type I DNA topoisomerase [candidate division Zixibacteria bacterium]
MAKNLVIVESPTKTKTLKKILGRDFSVLATKGHIMDLPKSRLGVDLENKFEPEYEVVPKRKETINELKKAAKEADKIYLAPDPDREGEAIAYHVAQLLKLKKPLRASFNEITKEAVKRGITEAGKIDLHKVEAQQARRILDRLVGYQISPLLWKTVHRGLSAGRVQSVALRLVCEREEEIEKFVPKEYWSIKAFFDTPKKETFAAKLVKIKGENFELGSKTATDAVLADIEKQKYAVSDQKTEERQKNPYPPYITSTLQQDASRRLGFSTSKTMTLAQRLYEGAEIGGETVGLITYMRTDSVRVAKEAQGAVSRFIQKQYGKEYLPEEPRFYKSKKGAQDAHEAIRPTYFDYPPTAVKKYLEKDLFRLYELIWNRFVASQMASAVFDTLTVEVAGGDYLFRATSQKLKFPGFLAVYDELKDENGDEEEQFEIPVLKVDTPLSLNKLEPAHHFTKPPARFTEAALVRELEARGIGRPSTYASIITTIKTRHYVEVKERRLTPTDLGKTVNRILVAEFPDIFDYEFTREMEEELDSVEDGKDDWVKVLKDFYEPFEEDLAAAKKKEKEIRKSTQEKSDEVCEKCGRPMLVRWGRHGKFLACSGYPECKSTKPLEGSEEAQEVSEKCDKCGSPMVVKRGRFGTFLACSAYPECKNTKALVKSTGVKCPEKCGGELVERRSKSRRIFYSCSKYPKCKFATWDRPVPTACPKGDSTYMLAKVTKAKGEYLLCPVCKTEITPTPAVAPVA